MESFWVGLNFELDEKPEWLDGFREKYDEPHPYHVSLKLSTKLDPKQLGEIQNRVASIVNRYEPMVLEFDSVFESKTRDGWCVMIRARENEQLVRLQADLRTELHGFGEHTKPYYAQFEENFTPHITIGRKLDDDRFEEAKAELQESTHCQATIKKVDLSIHDENYKQLDNWEYELANNSNVNS